ncbi:MAG: HAD family phosphatase [Jiangellales bacterium]
MTSDAQPRGLVVDWGGVLTEDVRVAIAMWAQSEGIGTQTMRSAFRRWLGPAEAEREMVNPVHLLERGEIEVAEFEHYLAGEMRDAGHPIVAEGLLRRMFSYFTHAPAMTSLVWRAHESGISTALLSNSWGNSYPAQVWDGMFDTVVISGEVGMRKPEPEIYTHTCSRLGLAPEQCVFVDDLAHNVEAAAALGMHGVHHVAYESTAAELSVLFGRDLTGSRDVE